MRCNFTSAIPPVEITEQSKTKIRVRMRNQRHLGVVKSSHKAAFAGACEFSSAIVIECFYAAGCIYLYA
jgi:hypothetical protein